MMRAQLMRFLANARSSSPYLPANSDLFKTMRSDQGFFNLSDTASDLHGYGGGWGGGRAETAA
jgi:hypothetical protein